MASSWRNEHQPEVVKKLRAAGHSVYDYKNKHSNFHWRHIDPEWENWDGEAIRRALEHWLTARSFQFDFAAMEWADVFVLALPCGRSAHLEAGWAIGQGKPTAILMWGDTFEPELMYKMASLVTTDIDELISWLADKREEYRNGHYYTDGKAAGGANPR